MHAISHQAGRFHALQLPLLGHTRRTAERMAMFNRNALPEEFQAEHGSVDLEDSSSSKPSAGGAAAAADDREDEDLDLARAGQRVWLCKVPRFLLDKWQQSSREGEILGRVRVYDESVPPPSSLFLSGAREKS